MIIDDLFYIAIDGDDVGIHLRNRIIMNDTKSIADYSFGLKTYFESIESWLQSLGASIVFCGGDSVLAYSKFESIQEVSNSIPKGICNVSVGFGKSAEYAYLALQLAKARGKGRVVVLNGTDAVTIKVFSQ